MNSPRLLLFLGLFLMLLGIALPFLMVIKVFESTFFLNFFSYTISTIGLIVGVVGAVYYVRLRK